MHAQSTALSRRQLKRYLTKETKTKPISKRKRVRLGVLEISPMRLKMYPADTHRPKLCITLSNISDVPVAAQIIAFK